MIVAGALLAGALGFGPIARGATGDRADSDFNAILSELHSAVAHTSDLRSVSNRSGDRVKETCVYERLRGIMQAVESTEVAKTAWESAVARGDSAGAKEELERAQRALELTRKMRNEADNCIGRELERSASSGSGTTIVTVETTVTPDDPNAGPAEYQVVPAIRLDLPNSGEIIAASPFTPPVG